MKFEIDVLSYQHHAVTGALTLPVSGGHCCISIPVLMRQMTTTTAVILKLQSNYNQISDSQTLKSQTCSIFTFANEH